MSVQIIKKDYTDEVNKDIQSAITEALETIGKRVVAYAKADCPVDTGKLRDSIQYVVDDSDNSLSVGTNVEYAPYVEMGTSRQKAQPFLRPAVTEHTDEYKKIFEDKMKNTS